MTVPNGGPEGNTTVRVPGGVAEVGGFGVAYLGGLLALTAAVALALRGTAGVRQNARVAGLGLAGATLGLLGAAAFSLDAMARRTLFYSPEDGFRVEYGRGLTAAFVTIVLLAAALYLAGRTAVPETGSDAGPGIGPAAPGRRRAREDELPPAPADLTVGPVAPFARPEPPR